MMSYYSNYIATFSIIVHSFVLSNRHKDEEALKEKPRKKPC